MATFVIVHGGWDGGWAWTPVARQLRRAGHKAFTPTLTGSGERAHLASPEVDLDTHIQDVVNVLIYEDLRDVILVGCSGGGMVVTGVADRVPERIGHLVYLDGFVPQDGESIGDLLGPDVMANFEQAARVHGDGWRIPMGDPDADRRTDVMLKVVQQPIALANPGTRELQRTFVLFTGKPAESWLTPVFERVAARIRAEGGWRYLERPFVHYPALDAPYGVKDLTDLLLELL